MSIKTQGTEFWAFNPLTGVLLDLGCITSIDGIDSTLEQIETTCLKDTARTYESGLATPGQASFEVQFDPDNPDHIELQRLKKAGITLQWLVGFRYDINGEAIVPGPAPTIDAATGEIELPSERAWILFNGYMSAFPFGFAQNDVVRSGVQVQISGDPEVVPRITPQDPTGVTVTPETQSVAIGSTEQLTAVVAPAGALQNVTWSTSNPAVATVTPIGLVTGVAAGTATITATSTTDTQISGDCVVTVEAP